MGDQKKPPLKPLTDQQKDVQARRRGQIRAVVGMQKAQGY
jgi:hypothetical protein